MGNNFCECNYCPLKMNSEQNFSNAISKNTIDSNIHPSLLINKDGYCDQSINSNKEDDYLDFLEVLDENPIIKIIYIKNCIRKIIKAYKIYKLNLKNYKKEKYTKYFEEFNTKLTTDKTEKNTLTSEEERNISFPQKYLGPGTKYKVINIPMLNNGIKLDSLLKENKNEKNKNKNKVIIIDEKAFKNFETNDVVPNKINHSMNIINKRKINL